MRRQHLVSRIVVVFSTFLNVASADAFEIRTHAKLTIEAWSRFLTENTAIMERLGIQDRPNAFEGNGYYDYRPGAGTTPVRRDSVEWHEDTIMLESYLKVPPFSVPGWLIRGAIREDDDRHPDEPTPKEDPHGDFHRVFSHFMDPANSDRGLQVGVLLGANAASWALDADAVTPSFLSAPQRYNHFNLATFRESMWRALTGLDKAGSTVARTAVERNLYWATAFRALGDILHLNQDMAQPQHTRNDAHAGGNWSFLAGHKSVLERYLEARITRQKGFSTRVNPNDTNVPIDPAPVSFSSSYPIPKFTRFVDYWTTADRKGLANYSNRGFFSLRTLPGSETPYASPPTALSSYVQLVKTLTAWDGKPVLGGTLSVTLFAGPVADALTEETSAGVALFARSVWDQAAQAIGLPFQPRLVKANYDDAISLIIPRAVAYSAGILQYAFRGKLALRPPAEGVYGLVDHSVPSAYAVDTGGFARLKINVRNVTEDITSLAGQTEPQALQPTGEIRAVVRFRRNTCYEAQRLLGQPGAPRYDPLTCRTQDEEIVVSDPQSTTPDINTANGQEFTFNFPIEEMRGPIPINAVDVRLQVVYRGPLGQETDAVVVETKDISEPSFYNFDNYSDCYRSVDGTYSTVAGAPLTASMSFNGGVTYNASVVNLPPGRYSRYAVLADHDRLPTREQGGYAYDFLTVMNQEVSGVTLATPINRARPTSVPPGSPEDYMYAYDGFGFYPAPTYAGAQECPTAVDPAPVPMTIVFQ